MLVLAALLFTLAALFAVRHRTPNPWHRRYDRTLAWASAGMAVVFVAFAPFEPTRQLVGFGMPAKCGLRPGTGPAGLGDADSDQVLQDEVARRELGREEPPPAFEVTDTAQIAVLTGPGATNDTVQRWHVYGTDLGHPFVIGDRIGWLFGDTFGDPYRNGWRSNVLAWSPAPADPDGVEFTAMNTGPDGQAVEILGSLKLWGLEQTVIPTYGVAVGDRIVVHYMSVTCWGVPGDWAVNHSGLAVSEDGGESFQRVLSARFPRGSGFAQVAFVTVDDHVYVFGIPEGRGGPVRLARVPGDDILDLTAWRYWTGTTWSEDEADAVPVVPAPAGELSVQWNDHVERWMMLYTDDPRQSIMLRTAPDLTGPWTAPTLVTSAADYPQLYAPYLVPTGSDSENLFFTMSRYDIYNVLFMQTRLRPVG